jgi:hypothetical protein
MRLKVKLFLVIFMAFAAVCGGINNVDAVSLQRPYENYVTYLVDGFNTPGSWVVKFSRYRVHNWDTNAPSFMDSQTFIRWKTVSGIKTNLIIPPYPSEQRRQMASLQPDTINNIVGIRAKYVINGHNWVVFEPAKPLFLRGIAKAIAFWVWGGNYRFNISITVKDYRGDIHELPGGRTDFIGWRYVRINIPHTIAQRDSHLPANKFLQFLRIKFLSDFDEVPDKFYVWLGSMWGEVDLYQDRFFGEGLLDEPNW